MFRAMTSGLCQRNVLLFALAGIVVTGCQDGAIGSADPGPGSVGGKADSFEDDDRTTVSESTDPRAARWAASVALLTSRIDDDNTASVPDLQERFDLCEGERFASDPFLGHCSAFLVGPMLVATAGHCLEQHACERTTVMFGFNDVERNDDITDLDVEQTYHCRAQSVDEEHDVALIELDRPVIGREPFEFGEASEGDSVALVGHPLGGRTTIDLSGTIEARTELQMSTTLDTFSGHSGAPVISLDTGRAVGIHVAGGGFSVIQSEAGCHVQSTCIPSEFRDCLGTATDVRALPQ